MEKNQVVNQEATSVEYPTGKLSIKHKAALMAVGAFFKWLGGKLMSVETYEEARAAIDEGERRMDTIENEHPILRETLELEEQNK